MPCLWAKVRLRYGYSTLNELLLLLLQVSAI